jgi:hypothetical protein
MLSAYSHLSNSGKHENPIDDLLKPSWLSGLFCAVGSLAVVLGAVGMLYYRSSSLHLLVQLQKSKPAPVDDYQTINTDLTTNTIISDIPLFIFWAGVGIVAYAFTAAIINALHTVVELQEESTYVHASRRELLKNAGERLLLRLGALIVWFIFLNYTLHLIIPYAIAVGYAGTSTSSWLQGSLYLLAGIGVLIICAHAHTILLRLIALRPRLFG